MLLISASLGLPTLTWAADPAADYVPMKIIQTEPVIFPRDALTLGITEGEADVSVQVDETGKLTDYLVTAYTYQSLADAAVVALKQWEYKPAYLHGEARSATIDLRFEFKSQGIVVVDLNLSSLVAQRDYQLHSETYAFHACTLRQLDRIPTPTKVVKPGFGLKRGHKPVTVTVDFYIDQNGRVRLPAVDLETGEAYDALSAAAVQAVSEWQFEPPMSRGQPVLVAAQQDFKFKPAP